MKLTICSIQDTRAAAWMNPMFFQSAQQAIRSFEDAVNQKDSEFGRHPEDYILFRLGEFDQRTGEIELEGPESLVLGSNLQRMERE